MKMLVDFTRTGRTQLIWNAKMVVFRKPQVHNPDKSGEYTHVEAKVDGRRVLCVGNEDGSGALVFSSNGILISDEVRNCHWYDLLKTRLQYLQWLDGEIFIPNGGRENLATALAEASDEIMFNAFGYSNLPANAAMEEVDSVLSDMKIASPPRSRIAVASGVLLKQRVENPNNALKNVAKLGPHYDGVVFKDGMYGAWAKYKHKKTIDVYVTAINPGKGKYAGQCGSLEGSICDDKVTAVVANVSGMDDDIRARITTADLNRVFEVEYERVGSAGRLQHPRFVQWRDDKRWQDCSPEQDPDLCD